MTREQVIRQAASVIEKLASQVESLNTQSNKRDEAEKIALTLFEQGKIDGKNLFIKVAELVRQPLDDLKTLGKALEIASNKESLAIKLGSISDETSPEALDPLTKMIFE